MQPKITQGLSLEASKQRKGYNNPISLFFLRSFGLKQLKQFTTTTTGAATIVEVAKVATFGEKSLFSVASRKF